MKLTITILSFLVCLLSGCGLDTEQLFEVQMFGVSQSATDASGESAPNFQAYRLTEVTLVSADGSSLTKLFDNEEELMFRIIDRPQQIYSKAIADLVDQVYSGVRISFDPLVKGGNQEHENLSFTMAQATLIVSKEFTIEKARSLELQIKLKWGNTILADQMTEPSFELTLK